MLDHDRRRGGRGNGGNGNGGDGMAAPFGQPEDRHPAVDRLLSRAHGVQDQYLFGDGGGGRRQWNPQSVADAAEAASALVAACRETGCDATEAAKALARNPTLVRHRDAVEVFAPMPGLLQATAVAWTMYERTLANTWLPTTRWK